MTNEIGVSFIVIFAPALFAVLSATLFKPFRQNIAWLVLPAPVMALTGLLSLSQGGLGRVIRFPWIPQLDIELSWLIDDVSLFYATVVAGIGALIVLYARFYLDAKAQNHHRFYAYLLLFMSAMLGTVLSNNLMTLFIFWELTGICSFFLIGFFSRTPSVSTRSPLGLRSSPLPQDFVSLWVLFCRAWFLEATTFTLFFIKPSTSPHQSKDYGPRLWCF